MDVVTVRDALHKLAKGNQDEQVLVYRRPLGKLVEAFDAVAEYRAAQLGYAWYLTTGVHGDEEEAAYARLKVATARMDEALEVMKAPA